MGVIEYARGQGIGRGLLLESLHAMAAIGYAYGIIGGAGSLAFYQSVVNVIEIPNSVPGIYGDRLGNDIFDTKISKDDVGSVQGSETHQEHHQMTPKK